MAALLDMMQGGRTISMLVVLALLLLDLWMYVWHRINHRVPVLWRFHRIHHNDPKMDVTTANRGSRARRSESGWCGPGVYNGSGWGS